MIFVDSSVLIDYFNGKDNWQVEKLDEILGKEIVVIGDYILVEVLQGFRKDKDYETAKEVLSAFPCLNMLGEEMALKSADNYRKLRKKGITIRKTVDVIISTFCIENDLELLHNDKDFFPFENNLGLKSVPLKSS
jgi:predicted nucleic acid-binding protein